MISNFLVAQVPQGVNYQAVYRNSTGVVKNTAITVECRVKQGSATGTTLCSETHNTETNEAGLFTLVIGDSTDPIGIFKNIDWDARDKIIKKMYLTLGNTLEIENSLIEQNKILLEEKKSY